MLKYYSVFTKNEKKVSSQDRYVRLKGNRKFGVGTEKQRNSKNDKHKNNTNVAGTSL